MVADVVKEDSVEMVDYYNNLYMLQISGGGLQTRIVSKQEPWRRKIEESDSPAEEEIKKSVAQQKRCQNNLFLVEQITKY
jgi:hypothetical protein